MQTKPCGPGRVPTAACRTQQSSLSLHECGLLHSSTIMVAVTESCSNLKRYSGLPIVSKAMLKYSAIPCPGCMFCVGGAEPCTSRHGTKIRVTAELASSAKWVQFGVTYRKWACLLSLLYSDVWAEFVNFHLICIWGPIILAFSGWDVYCRLKKKKTTASLMPSYLVPIAFSS